MAEDSDPIRLMPAKQYSPKIEQRRREARAIRALLESPAVLKPRGRQQATLAFRDSLMRLGEDLLQEPTSRRPQELLALEVQYELEVEQNVDPRAVSDQIVRLLCLWVSVEQDGIDLDREANESEFTLLVRCLPCLDRVKASETTLVRRRKEIYRAIRQILQSQLGRLPRTDLDVAMAEALVEANPETNKEFEGLQLEYAIDWSPERVAFCRDTKIDGLAFELATRLDELEIGPLSDHRRISLIAKMLSGLSALLVSDGAQILSDLPILRS